MYNEELTKEEDALKLDLCKNIEDLKEQNSELEENLRVLILTKDVVMQLGMEDLQKEPEITHLLWLQFSIQSEPKL
jgi:hypothetical protein